VTVVAIPLARAKFVTLPAALVRRGTDACFIVRDTNRQALAYVYFEGEPSRRAAAKFLTRTWH